MSTEGKKCFRREMETSMRTAKLSEQVQELADLAFLSGPEVRVMLIEGWLEIKEQIPPSLRKSNAEEGSKRWTLGHTLAHQSDLREALQTLAFWLEGWEARV